MILTATGWLVVHSLWQGAFIAGLAALTLGLIRKRAAAARYRIACASLAAMVIAPLVTAFTGLTMVRPGVRMRTMGAIDGLIGFPALVWWGSIVVPVIGALWIAGVAVCVIRIVLAGFRARALRQHDLGSPGERVDRLVADLRSQMSVARPVDVRSSTHAAVPMLLGLWRPVILLPAGTAHSLPASQLRAVLAHELAHVRRRDYAVNLVQLAADALLFHHPGARWLSGYIRAEREYCCDDVAVRMGGDAGDYARGLAALEDARINCRLAVAAASGTLLDRIQRIIGHPRPELTPARGAVVLVGAVLAGAAVLALAMAVPPGLPWGTEVRRRTPPPSGTVTGAQAGEMTPLAGVRQRRP
jgi:beta-lactamase regulating signal transducer with metallopeptidase domain